MTELMDSENKELSSENDTFEDTHKDTVMDSSVSNLGETPLHGRTSKSEGEQMMGPALSPRTEMVSSGSHLEGPILGELSGSFNQHDTGLGLSAVQTPLEEQPTLVDNASNILEKTISYQDALSKSSLDVTKEMIGGSDSGIRDRCGSHEHLEDKGTTAPPGPSAPEGSTMTEQISGLPPLLPTSESKTPLSSLREEEDSLAKRDTSPLPLSSSLQCVTSSNQQGRLWKGDVAPPPWPLSGLPNQTILPCRNEESSLAQSGYQVFDMTLQDQASFYSVGSSEEWLVNQCLGDPKQTIHPGAQSSFLSSIDRTEESVMHPSLFDGATTPTENGCSLHPRTGNKVSPSMSPIEQNSPISQKKEDDESFGVQGPPSPPQNGKGKLHPSIDDGQSRQKDSDPSQPEPTYNFL